MRERAADIARLLTQEQGKPFAEARGEVLAGADIIEWFADEGRRVYGRIVPSRNLAAQQLVMKEPLGPVAAFTPWNFPINQIVRKLGAALASGCSFLVKAPEETPASPAALLQAFVDAGVPAGTVGLVFGDPAEISSYLIPHPIIRKVTFTGSTPVGKQLAALAGAHMKRATMELGGHAPVIVAADADVALAVKAVGRRQVPQRGAGLHLADALPGAQQHPRRVRAGDGEACREPEAGRRPERRHHARPAGQCAPAGRDGEGARRRSRHRRQGGDRRRARRAPTATSSRPRC